MIPRSHYASINRTLAAVALLTVLAALGTTREVRAEPPNPTAAAETHHGAWRRDVVDNGVAFSRLRDRGERRIGKLKEDTLIAGRPCRRGWVHLHANGMPAAFTAARQLEPPRFTIAAGTWVMQDAAGVVTACAFPNDTEIQGHLCRGTGGSKGVQASFHRDGSLKLFFPPRDVVIDGVACRAGLVHGWVELHPNGRLRSARLDHDLVRGDRRWRAGTRVELDSQGNMSSEPG